MGRRDTSLVKVDVTLRSVQRLMLLTHWADNINISKISALYLIVSEQPDGLFHGLVRQALGLAGGCPAGEAAQGKSQGKSCANCGHLLLQHFVIITRTSPSVLSTCLLSHINYVDL